MLGVRGLYGRRTSIASPRLSSDYCDWRILPRSLHRPVAVVEGSLTKNLNKTGVRLGTDRLLDENCEVRRGDPLERHSGRRPGDRQPVQLDVRPGGVHRPRRDAECAV